MTTHCYKLWHMLLASAVAFAAAYLAFVPDENATINGTKVPHDLHCDEEEAIHFDSDTEAPYSLGCIHIDEVSTH